MREKRELEHISSSRSSFDQALRKSEQRLQLITEHMVDLVIQVDADLGIEFVSPSVKKLLGYEISELLGRKVGEIVSGGDIDRLLSLVAGEIHEVKADLRLKHRDGSHLWLEFVGTGLREGEEVAGAIFGGRDITDRKKKEEELRISEERYRTILENIEDGYFEIDLRGNLTYASAPCLRITGTTWEVLRGMNFKSYTPREEWPRLYESFSRVYATGRSVKGLDWQVVRLDGSRAHIDASISLMRDAEGKPIGFRGIVRDVTEKKLMEDKLKWMAYHDPLTGLPNRTLFYDRAAVALAQARRKERPLGVMMLDLDGFKEINDRYGHAMGDRILVAVAERLRGIFRGADTVARVGGDEFAVLLAETEGAAVPAVTDRIREAFAAPVTLAEGEFFFSLSTGFAVYPKDGEDIDALLVQADRAMYGFKVRSHRNRR